MSRIQCPEDYVQVREGLARICVPDPKKYTREDGIYEPAWAPVFYNPAMISNRDLAVLFLRAYFRSHSGNIVVLDPLASTGVRSIRFALEVPKIDKIYAGDLSPRAYEIMKINAMLNAVMDKLDIELRDANEFMYYLAREKVYPHYIDIDPFGSPAPFTLAALATVRRGGIVAFTATDLAPLEGKYPHKLFRRYGIRGLKIDISKDIAIRNLLAFVFRMATIVDRYIKPLFSYYHRHYIRIYVEVREGGTKANDVLSRCIGAIFYCMKCGYREISAGILDANRICKICGERMIRIEPTWICETGSNDVIKLMNEELVRTNWIIEESRNILNNILKISSLSKSLLPTRISRIASFLKKNMPPISSVIACLENKGYRALRYTVYHDAILSDAPYEEIINCVKSLP